MKQSRCAFAECFAVCNLIPIGHVEVAMPSNIVYESVHCGYCWLTDQSQGCLIQGRCPAGSWKLEERHSGSFYAASCWTAV